MRRTTTMAGLVAVPLLATAPLLAVSTSASAQTVVDSTTTDSTVTSTLRLAGSNGFVAVGTVDGVEQAHTNAATADAVRHPEPGATGPLVIGDRCFSPANGPGLPYALVIDATDPSRCLTMRTVAGADGSLRFVADDAFSPGNGLTLEQTPGSSALRLGDAGSDFGVVTRGEFTAPELTETTITVGSDLVGTAQPGAHVVVVRGADVLCEADAAGEDASEPGTWSCAADLQVGEHDLELYGVSAANQPAGPRAVHVVVADPGTDPSPEPGPDPDPGTDPEPGTDPAPGVDPAPGAGALPGAPSSITAPTPTSSPTATAALPDRLAYTGAEVGTATAAAGVLLGLGGLLTVLRRRLRRS